MVEFLLKNSASVNLDTRGVTPLHGAYENRRYKVMQYLLDNDADVNYFSDSVDCLIFRACYDNDTEAVAILLKSKNIELNTTVEVKVDVETIKSTPLITACSNGNYKIVKSLLDKKANVNYCAEDEMSPLFVACRYNHEDVVQVLLERGADVNLCRLSDNYSPLSIACRENFDKIVKHLLHKHADANLCGIDNTSPLFFALENKNAQIYQLLVKWDADKDLASYQYSIRHKETLI